MLDRAMAPKLPDFDEVLDGYSSSGTSGSMRRGSGWESVPDHPLEVEEDVEFPDEPEGLFPPRWLPSGTSPIACEQEAIRQAVLDWRIEAMGDQPRHHMARDLLHAGLLGDPRTVQYHDLTLDPPAWIRERTAHVPPKFRIPAIQHTALDYLHRSHLGRLWINARNHHGPIDRDFLFNGRDYGLLLSLAACRPVGALLTWQGAEPRPFDFTCGYARVCPWCHARKVVELHDRLVAGPCRPERMEGKSFVRVGIKIQGDDLRTNEGFAEFAQARGHDFGLHKMRPDGRSIRMRHHLDEADARFIRDFLAHLLDRITAGLGIAGGIVTYQVGPQLSRDGVDWDPFDYRHEMDIVGELDGPDRVEPFQRIMRIGTDVCPMICGRSIYASGIRADLADGGDPGALRLLLAGPSYRPVAARRSIRTNGAAPHYDGGRGGVLRQPPWFLADPLQWWPHYEATRRLRLYSAFGTWKEELARARAGNQVAQPAVLAGRSRQNQAEALHRRQKLLKTARAIGKGLGHRKLRAAMAYAGHIVSERDARWWAERID